MLCTILPRGTTRLPLKGNEVIHFGITANKEKIKTNQIIKKTNSSHQKTNKKFGVSTCTFVYSILDFKIFFSNFISF